MPLGPYKVLIPQKTVTSQLSMVLSQLSWQQNLSCCQILIPKNWSKTSKSVLIEVGQLYLLNEDKPIEV